MASIDFQMGSLHRIQMDLITAFSAAISEILIPNDVSSLVLTLPTLLFAAAPLLLKLFSFTLIFAIQF